MFLTSGARIRQARANKAIRPYQIKNAKVFPSKEKKSYAIDRPFRTYLWFFGFKQQYHHKME
jgi:hypothetical protein